MYELEELDDILERLDNLVFRIEEAGEVAEPGTVIEVVPHSSSGKRYARKRRAVKGKNAFEGCGVEGSERHLAAIRRGAATAVDGPGAGGAAADGGATGALMTGRQRHPLS